MTHTMASQRNLDGAADTPDSTSTPYKQPRFGALHAAMAPFSIPEQPVMRHRPSETYLVTPDYKLMPLPRSGHGDVALNDTPVPTAPGSPNL